MGIACVPGLHRHPTNAPGCTYPSQRTKAGICGRTPRLAFLGGTGAVEYRCEIHGNDAAREEAARLGYKAAVLLALEAHEARS